MEVNCESNINYHDVMLTCLGNNVKDTTSTTQGYSDVAVQSDRMYAARLATPLIVDVYDNRTWQLLWEIPTPCRLREDYIYHTLQVTGDSLLLCCFNNSNLHAFSHSGKLLQTHGRSWREASKGDIMGKRASGDSVYGPGVLFGPRLCQVDDDGSALVADCHNDRFQVMRADGTWSVVGLDHIVDDPKAAVWCNMSLYVANDDKLVRFS